MTFANQASRGKNTPQVSGILSAARVIVYASRNFIVHAARGRSANFRVHLRKIDGYTSEIRSRVCATHDYLWKKENKENRRFFAFGSLLAELIADIR